MLPGNSEEDPADGRAGVLEARERKAQEPRTTNWITEHPPVDRRGSSTQFSDILSWNSICILFV